MPDKKKSKSELYKAVRKIRIIVFDFDGVFTDNRVIVTDSGSEAVICDRSDGLGISRAKKAGIETIVISTEVNPVVGLRCKKLKIDCIQACNDKVKALEKKIKEQGYSFEETAFLGNDINDLSCLQKVGLPACVADAYPEVKKVCLYVTKRSGGRGAVREFCDFITGKKNG